MEKPPLMELQLNLIAAEIYRRQAQIQKDKKKKRRVKPKPAKELVKKPKVAKSEESAIKSDNNKSTVKKKKKHIKIDLTESDSFMSESPNDLPNDENNPSNRTGFEIPQPIEKIKTEKKAVKEKMTESGSMGLESTNDLFNKYNHGCMENWPQSKSVDPPAISVRSDLYASLPTLPIPESLPALPLPEIPLQSVQTELPTEGQHFTLTANQQPHQVNFINFPNGHIFIIQ
jgi:hypothetical protein